MCWLREPLFVLFICKHDKDIDFMELVFPSRSMTIRAQDRLLETSYRPMRDCNMDDEGIFVYRDGTLDHITRMVCSNSRMKDDGSTKDSITGSRQSRNKSGKSSNSLICMIPLDDLFPRRDIIGLGWCLWRRALISSLIRSSGHI